MPFDGSFLDHFLPFDGPLLQVAARDGKDPREFCINSKRFVGDADGNLTGIETVPSFGTFLNPKTFLYPILTFFHLKSETQSLSRTLKPSGPKRKVPTPKPQNLRPQQNTGLCTADDMAVWLSWCY